MAAAGPSWSLPPNALREQFGSKPPDITRKITACIACRKQKIRCIMGKDGVAPCVRCKKRGLPCTVNKSLQTILESDADWKQAVEQKLYALEAGLGKLTSHLSLPDFLSQHLNDPAEDDDDDQRATAVGQAVGKVPPEIEPQLQSQPRQNFEMTMDPDAGPAAIPGSIVSLEALPFTEQARQEQDIVAQGLITRENAERYLDVYRNRLDHFLYRILGDRNSLDQIRAASPLLLAAVSSVGALHLAESPDFEKCYREFVNLAATHSFSRNSTVDDVRGLCIAAFWLTGISWTCVGMAVRISTDMGLHRSIFKALQGDRMHYQRTRLYYLVYICDHHFSVAYGRPPLTREDDSVRAIMEFMQSEHAVEDDARLVSQVQFWSVGTEIYDTFGVDVQKPLTLADIEPLRRLNVQLDTVRAKWEERFLHNRYVGNYPRKGVGMHSHFMKLYLNSMAFRGIKAQGFRSPQVADAIDELANCALTSATAILQAVVSDSEVQGYLNGLPTYFDVMIAFAVVFVLRVSTTYAHSVRISDISEIHSLVANVVSTLKNITTTMHPRHLLASIARGSENLLQTCAPLETSSSAVVPCTVPAGLSFDDSLYDPAFDHFFMGEFDFLSTKDAMSQYQPYEPQ